MKNTFSTKTAQNTKLLFCFLIMITGLFLTSIDNSVLNNGILGTGVLLSGYNFMKLINQ
jgi:hypothetical protein